MKKTETKKTETKKPTVGTKKPFWDGRSRASTPGYTDYAIFKFQSVFKVNGKKYYHLTNFIV